MFATISFAFSSFFFVYTKAKDCWMLCLDFKIASDVFYMDYGKKAMVLTMIGMVLLRSTNVELGHFAPNVWTTRE